MISNLAYIHPDAIIGKDVTIEPFAYIDKNVVIGDGTWVGPNATVLYGARIGKDCRIFPSAVVSGIPQDLKFKGEDSITIIGDRTSIREGATVHRGTASKGKTVVGNDCLLMEYTHVAHDCVLGDHIIIGNTAGLAGEVHVDDWAIISAGTLVHQFVHIGPHVMIGGGSLARIDVPPFVLADREPLSFMGVNKVGLSRRGFDKERIENIHEIYRIIYLRKMNITQALETIEKEIAPSEDRDLILNFYRNSERGVIRTR